MFLILVKCGDSKQMDDGAGALRRSVKGIKKTGYLEAV